jgi:alpha-L-rhamnosidase
MKFWVVIGLVCLTVGLAFGQQLTPISLTTEYRTEPLGIGESLPRLAWLLQSTDPNVRGQTQTAYEIRVASTPAILANGHGDLWSSGKVLSRMTSQIEYAGDPLGSGQACWWQVRVWNGANEVGPWSAPATWSAGLFERNDWKGDWIGMDSAAMGRIPPMHLVGCQWVWTDENTEQIVHRTRYFRGHFTIPSGRTMQSAILAMTASNQFSAWVNGHHLLAGHDRQTLECRDVSFALHTGENVSAVSAENDGANPALAGRLEIRFATGLPTVFDVDARWKSSAEAPKGWQSPGFEDLTWKHVQTLGAVGRQPWGEPTQVNLPLDPAVYLRREFTIAKPIVRAMLYTTALGNYELHLNGTCVTRDQLSPSFSDFRKRVYYQTYDVTHQVQLGHNALGIVLTDGWYGGYWPSTQRTHNYGGDPRAFAQLELDYPDGSTVAITTDDKWRMILGPIRQADSSTGEVYDGREDLGSWDDPLYKGRSWMRPKVGLNAPEPLLTADPGWPARAQETFAGKTAREEMPGVSLVDFGRGVAGHIRLHGWATKGDVIEIRYAMKLDADGSLPLDPVQPAHDTDVYVAGETGDFTFEPSSALHHFRMVEITGLSKMVTAAQVEAIAVYPDAERTGWFVSSDPVLNHRATQAMWAQRNHGIDSPTEHFLAAGMGAYENNLAPQYYRLLDTLSDAAHIAFGGVITSSSPLDHQTRMRDGLQDAEPIVLWELLRMYGDQRVLRRHFAEVADYVTDLHLHWQDYAHHDRFFADAAGGTTEDAEMIALAYAAHVSDLTSQMSAELGNEADAVDFRRMSDDLTRQFQDRYLNIGSRSGMHTQTGYTLALQWGLIPDDTRTDISNQLIHHIDQNEGKIAMGDLGRSQLLFALSDSGHSDASYRLLADPTFEDPWASRWLYENAAGISPAAFGFTHIHIEPHITDSLQSAGAVYDSTVGRIVCKWKRDDNGIHFDVTVPINCTAELDVPEIKETNMPGVKFVGNLQNEKVYELQSGNYDFTATP